MILSRQLLLYDVTAVIVCRERRCLSLYQLTHFGEEGGKKEKQAWFEVLNLFFWPKNSVCVVNSCRIYIQSKMEWRWHQKQAKVGNRLPFYFLLLKQTSFALLSFGDLSYWYRDALWSLIVFPASHLRRQIFSLQCIKGYIALT